jgi:hypothetical protein
MPLLKERVPPEASIVPAFVGSLTVPLPTMVPVAVFVSEGAVSVAPESWILPLFVRALLAANV